MDEIYGDNKKGIVKTIFIVFIGVVLLTYFGIDLEQAVKSELVSKNISYSYRMIKQTWGIATSSVDKTIHSIKNIGISKRATSTEEALQ